MKQINHKSMLGTEFSARKLDAREIATALEKANPGFVCGKANLPDKILMYTKASLAAPFSSDRRPVRGEWEPVYAHRVIVCQVSSMLPWRPDLQVGVTYRCLGKNSEGLQVLAELTTGSLVNATLTELMPEKGFRGEFIPEPCTFRPSPCKPSTPKFAKGDKIVFCQFLADKFGKSKARDQDLLYRGNRGVIRSPLRGSSTDAFWVAMDGCEAGQVCLVHADEVAHVCSTWH